jgi:SAM-dependent methyltransferase
LSEARDRPERLVTAASGRDAGRIYLVADGVKRWILSPDVFLARGHRFEDVETVDPVEIETIPTSPVVIGAEPSPEAFQKPRLRASAPFLRGRGLEIGAGMNPQWLPSGVACERFDLRGAAEIARLESATREHGLRPDEVPAVHAVEEIPRRFPDGADFVLAHNVLEHCADPIGTLLAWCSHLRSGGVLVVSVPDHDHCPDAGRLVAPLEHLVADHLLVRDGDAFESREHAYSCAAGWMNFWEDWLPLDRRTLAERLHAMAAMPALDVHWHAFTPLLLDELLQATSLLAPRALRLLAWADPASPGDGATAGDVIAVLRVGDALPCDPELPWRARDVVERVRAFRDRLAAAASRLARV